MKNYLFLLLSFVLFISCNSKPQYLEQKYIEPSEYNVMDYEVKDTSYHKLAVSYVRNSHVYVIGDSIFNISKNLGDFLFKGNRFSYKILGDSLLLSNQLEKQSYKILNLNPNSFSIEVNNTYFKRIGLIKPKDKRRKVVKTVNIEY